MDKKWYESKGKFGAIILFLYAVVGMVTFAVSGGDMGVPYNEGVGWLFAAISLFGVRAAIK